MYNHHFLFTPGPWLGEGVIRLSNIEEELKFFTRWKTSPFDPQIWELDSLQEIQIAGHSDIMLNQYLFSALEGKRFEVELENQAWGRVFGEGMIDQGFVGWEFRDNDIGFEGYEFYQLQDDGTYLMKAEYVSGEDYRTTIEGKIWKQKKQDVKK
jgi:hypothetical protein